MRQRSKPHQDGRAVHSVDLAHLGMGSIRTLPQAAHMLDGRQQTLYQLQVARDGLGDSHTGQYSTYWPPWQVHQPRARRVLLMSVETWRFRSMCALSFLAAALLINSHGFARTNFSSDVSSSEHVIVTRSKFTQSCCVPLICVALGTTS